MIAAAAGARRTETAVSRFARATKTTDVAMQTGARFGFADLTMGQVKRLPQVASADRPGEVEFEVEARIFQRRAQVPQVVRVDYSLNDLHVFLRHRRSIPQAQELSP